MYNQHYYSSSALIHSQVELVCTYLFIGDTIQGFHVAMAMRTVQQSRHVSMVTKSPKFFSKMLISRIPLTPASSLHDQC